MDFSWGFFNEHSLLCEQCVRETCFFLFNSWNTSSSVKIEIFLLKSDFVCSSYFQSKSGIDTRHLSSLQAFDTFNRVIVTFNKLIYSAEKTRGRELDETHLKVIVITQSQLSINFPSFHPHIGSNLIKFTSSVLT